VISAQLSRQKRVEVQVDSPLSIPYTGNRLTVYLIHYVAMTILHRIHQQFASFFLLFLPSPGSRFGIDTTKAFSRLRFIVRVFFLCLYLIPNHHRPPFGTATSRRKRNETQIENFLSVYFHPRAVVLLLCRGFRASNKKKCVLPGHCT
jgi:hypothetical protein